MWPGASGFPVGNGTSTSVFAEPWRLTKCRGRSPGELRLLRHPSPCCSTPSRCKGWLTQRYARATQGQPIAARTSPRAQHSPSAQAVNHPNLNPLFLTTALTRWCCTRTSLPETCARRRAWSGGANSQAPTASRNAWCQMSKTLVPPSEGAASLEPREDSNDASLGLPREGIRQTLVELVPHAKSQHVSGRSNPQAHLDLHKLGQQPWLTAFLLHGLEARRGPCLQENV